MISEKHLINQTFQFEFVHMKSEVKAGFLMIVIVKLKHVTLECLKLHFNHSTSKLRLMHSDCFMHLWLIYTFVSHKFIDICFGNKKRFQAVIKSVHSKQEYE